MDKFTHLSDFLGYLFDDERTIKKAQAITAGILQAHSCRLSDIAREMAGNEATNYKCIQRFVAQTALKSILLRLFQEETPFLIGNPTEMPRPEAQKTDYVGTLSDGQTSGYWLLILATPLSRTGDSVPFRELFFRHPWVRSDFPQPLSLSGFCRSERIAG